MRYTYLYYILLAQMIYIFGSCQKINSALDAEPVQYISINLTAQSQVEGVESIEGLKVVFENFEEKYKVEQTLSDGPNHIEKLIPGLYSINISGTAESENQTYYLSGSKVNYMIIEEGDNIEIDISGATVGPLAFSEIFYSGTTPFYFRNQFYEITNNSDETVYLGGLYFANLTPGTATTTLPIWPEEDGNKYAYAERVWKIPGGTKDFPLQPGESFSIAQFAANHQLPQYSPDSPIDCSTSEFEFNMNNANFPDQPAEDMVHIFYNGHSALGTLQQYLTSVFGGAYVIFKVPEGQEYDPVNNKNLQTRNLGSTSPNLYAKIPIEYIMDAVEAGHNENMIASKRVPSVLDAGMTYVGATYNSKGVRRKKTGTRDNGTPILMDTNNSTEDFERMVTPSFRYHGQQVPTWSLADQ